MEDLGIVPCKPNTIYMFDIFFKNRRIFITGHTGFKGSWLCLWLQRLGAKITGYALEPPTEPNLFDLCNISQFIDSIHGDVRNQKTLQTAMEYAEPEIVIHMAAQPLVRNSYKNPVETYEINVMGTINLFEAVRQVDGIRAVINVTTDKVYENKEWIWGYRENEPLGGYDPYSSSKACSELVTSAYRNSFFNPLKYNDHGVAVASVRAGNVIGGGDWGTDRLIPDCVRSLLTNQPVMIRNPDAVRPWQHVLEPLRGYLMLAQKMCEEGPRYSQAWNFGPYESDARPVKWITQRICSLWGSDSSYNIDPGNHPHEATYLKLDCSKAAKELGWRPIWTLDEALKKIIEWTLAYQNGEDLREICLKQIMEYMAAWNRQA